MSLDGAYSEIRTRITTVWPTLEAAVPLAFPDENFQEPDPPAPWLFVEIRWSGGEIITIGAPGSNRARRDGWVSFSAMVPTGTGEQRGMQLIGKAGGMLEGQTVGSATFFGMEPGGGVSTTDSGLYTGQTADVSFYVDDDI